MNNTVFVPCANNGQGDTIQLSGGLHVLFIVTLDNNGGFTLHVTTNGQDVTVSTTTGVKYQGAVGDNLTINGKVGFLHAAITPHNSFILIGQGKGFQPNRTVHYASNCQSGRVRDFKL